MADLDLTAADVRKLLQEKYPAETDKEKVYVSIMLALADSVENLEKLAKLVVKQVAQQDRVLKGLSKVAASFAEKAGIDIAALLTGSPAAAPAQEEASGPTDQTPFPAGVSAGGAPGSPPKVTVQTPPAAEEAEEEGIPEPNVASGPARNAAPIPSRAPAQNGAKV